MRIPSGVTDQVIYFVGVDATDKVTRETGLSSFTVYRDRNGGGAAAMTTPTITEVDGTNMPGVYKLLADEDMTIGSGNDSEEMVFHITHAGMEPVTRAIELYRSKITAGYTLGVGSDGDLLEVNALTGHTAQTGDSYAVVTGDHGLVSIQDDVDAILADTNELQGDWANGGRLDTLLDGAASAGDPWTTALPGAYGAGTAGLLLGTTIPTAIADIPTNAELALRTLPSADYTVVSDLGTVQTADHTAAIADIPTNAELATAVANVSVDEIQATALADLFNTDSGTTYAAAIAGSVVKEIADNAGGSALTASGIADAVWDETVADHAGVGSTGAALAAAGGSGDPWATALPGAYGSGTAGKIIGDNINAPIATVDTVVDSLATELAKVPKSDSNVTFNATALASINTQADLALSDYDPPTRAELTSDTNAIIAQVDANETKIDTIDTVVDGIQTDLSNGTDGLGALKTILDVIATDTTTDIPATLATIAGYLDTEIATILEDTGTTIPGLISGLNNISAADVWSAVTRTLTANTNLNDLTVADIIAGISDGTYDLQEMLRIMFAILAGHGSGGGSPTVTYKDPTNVKSRIVATVDEFGNRTPTSYDGS